jgi:hypothetical protein
MSLARTSPVQGDVGRLVRQVRAIKVIADAVVGRGMRTLAPIGCRYATVRRTVALRRTCPLLSSYVLTFKSQFQNRRIQSHFGHLAP